MIERFRAKLIKIQDCGNFITLRTRGGLGKKIILKSDLEIKNKKLTSDNYFISKKTCDIQHDPFIPTKTVKVDKLFDKTPKILDVHGFCATGSSAVIDLLREFEGMLCLANADYGTNNAEELNQELGLDKKYINIEFSLYKNLKLYRLFDLLYIDDFLRLDAEIKALIINSKNILEAFNNSRCFDKNVFTIFNNFILSFAKLAHTSNFDITKPIDINNIASGNFDYFILQENITNDKLHYFIAKFFSDLFGAANMCDKDGYLVLDQLLACENGNNLDYHCSFLGDLKQIAVYRDPRDQLYENLKYGFHTSFFNNDFVNFLNDHEKIWNEYEKYFIPDPRRLFIRFEDLIYDYDNSLKKICEHLNLDIKKHKAKGRYFSPEKSSKNVGIYKHFFDQSIMEKIYNKFQHLCY